MTTCLCKTPLTLRRCYTVQSQHTLGAFEERSRSWLCLLTRSWQWWQHPLLVLMWRETPLQLLVRGQLRLLLSRRLLLSFRPVNCFPGVTKHKLYQELIHGACRCFWEAENLKDLNRKRCCITKGNRKNCLQKRWYRPLCTHSLFTETGVVANEDLTGLFTICSFHLSEHACSLSSALRRLYGITLIPLLFCIFLLNRCHLFIFLLSSSYSLTSSQLWVVEGVRQGIYGICSVTSSQTCQRINEVKRVCGRFDQPALRWVTSGLNSLEFCFPQNS